MSQERSLIELIESRIADGDVQLPASNKVAVELSQLVGRADYDISDVQRILESDQALAAAVLRAANSSFFGGLAEITTIEQAVVRLGLAEVLRMATLAAEQGQYRVHDPELQRFIEPLWHHARACALGARWLARTLCFPELENEAFISGLLHDIGKLLLLRVLDDLRQGEARDHPVTSALIDELFDSAHCRQGHQLVATWSFPEALATVVRDHHAEHADSGDTTMLLVRLANRACRKLGIGMNRDDSVNLVASEEAFELGASEIHLAELEIMLEDTEAVVES